MSFVKKAALPFSVLFGIGLAITIPLLLGINTESTSSNETIAVTVLLAVLISAVASVFLVLLYFLTVVAIPMFLKRISAWITIQTLSQAIIRHSTPVQASGIGSREGDVVVGLASGAREGVTLGHRFAVFNTASQEKLGVMEVSEISERPCVCSVVDRINPDFWANLERRMGSDPAPPQGITIRREVPEEELLDRLTVLLKNWRG